MPLIINAHSDRAFQSVWPYYLMVCIVCEIRAARSDKAQADASNSMEKLLSPVKSIWRRFSLREGVKERENAADKPTENKLSHPRAWVETFFYFVPSSQLSRPGWTSNWAVLLFSMQTNRFNCAHMNIITSSSAGIHTQKIRRSPRSPLIIFNVFVTHGAARKSSLILTFCMRARRKNSARPLCSWDA